MYCPYCHNQETSVLDSRDREDEAVIRRRRECSRCDKRFTTYERIETDLKVIKKDGRREDFSRDKLITGMVRACKKRPITVEEINKIADRIEAKLRSLNTTTVETSIIGKLVMQELKKVDPVAYLRFASIYLDFQDLESFRREAQLLLAKNRR